MSSSRRKNTVYDLASLRLRPDGTKATRSRNAKLAAKDALGNWLALDAGGSGKLKTRRASRKQEDENAQAGPSSSAIEKGKTRATEEDQDEDTQEDNEAIPKDPGARRRIAFNEDLSFLDPPPARARGTGPPDSPYNLPPPESVSLRL